MAQRSSGTTPAVSWPRALGGLLAGVLAAFSVVAAGLAAASVVAAGYAAVALLSQATDAKGAVCGSVWRFHEGSGTTITGAGRTAAQHAAFVAECNRSGDADYRRGVRWAWLSASAAVSALTIAAALALAGRVPTARLREGLSGPAAPPAPTAGPPPGSGRSSPRPRRPVEVDVAAAQARPPSHVS